MEKQAVIIGAGIAGLACALRLRSKGYHVNVYEANATYGGKMGSLEKKGFRWDTGPSLFTMPHFVDELYELYQDNPREHFNYLKKETACHYFWEDGTTFSAKAHINQFVEEASSVFGVNEQLIQNYLRRSKEKYDLTSDIFLNKSLHKLSTYLSWDTLSSLIQSYKLDISRSLNEVNEDTLKEPHLVQLFNRYATYNGSSPFQTPGIMSMIPHLELHYGTFLPHGGMRSIAESLYSLALSKGIQFHFNTPILEIETHGNQATGIRTEVEFIGADIVVSNMDIFATYHRLLPRQAPPEKILSQERSSSALIFYWGIDRTFPSLDLHNILFSGDYAREFQLIFEDLDVSDDPTVYINITSKDEPGDAPDNCENWFVMINTPGNSGQDWEAIIDRVRQIIIQKVNRILSTNIEEHIVVEEILDPRTIEERTSSHKGSLYGAASNNRFAAFLRHPNFSRKMSNLFFCGGSVHPGGGIPLCLLSAKIVSDLIPNP